MLNLPAPPSLADEDKIPSPALLIFPEIAKRNIAKATEIAGNPKRLRPHVKTHKMPQIIQMHLAQGINKFKCATLAEVKMVAEAGARDVLLAYPLVGPEYQYFFEFVKQWPEKTFSVVVDNLASAKLLAAKAEENSTHLATYIDIDNGMERTGIKPGKAAFELYAYLDNSPHLKAAGLHIYDGHLHIHDIEKRTQACDAAFADILQFSQDLQSAGFSSPELICGGTPTFPVHSQYADRILSPGTYVFWDAGYANSFQDLKFEYAAWLLTRVVSKPGSNKLCLDLGYKALASEMNESRVVLAGLDDAKMVGHSEEHLVLESNFVDNYKVGDVIYALPWHICPTVALYDRCYVVENKQLMSTWPIVARQRTFENYA